MILANRLKGKQTVAAPTICTGKNLAILDSLKTNSINNAMGIVTLGDIAYVSAPEDERFTTFNIKDPYAIVELDSFRDNTNLSGTEYPALSADGKFAIVTGSSLTSFNVSDPTNITKLDVLKRTTWMKQVVVRGNVAYVVHTGQGHLITIDLTDYSNLSELDEATQTLDSGWGVALSPDGNTAFVTGTKNSKGTITSFNVTDPSNISVISLYTMDNTTGAAELKISPDGKTAFIAAAGANKGNIVSINITNTSAMSERDRVLVDDELAGASGLDLSGNVACVSSYHGDSLVTFDITDPDNMLFIDRITKSSTLEGARGVAVNKGTAYVVTQLSNSIVSIDICEKP